MSQTTLADVFSDLAINIEHPFAAGDWITMNDNVEGQIIEIDWRATRIRTFANDMVVIPNSVIAKAIVTNHRKLNEPYVSISDVYLFYFVTPNGGYGENMLSTRPATPETIKGRGEPIMESQIVVDDRAGCRGLLGCHRRQ
jgi:hypothetical protein